jgi:hypothetical protein
LDNVGSAHPNCSEYDINSGRRASGNGCREGENGRMMYFKLNDYVTTTREYPYHHVFGHIPKGTQFTVA